jgi:hypothetical protein
MEVIAFNRWLKRKVIPQDKKGRDGRWKNKAR